MFFLARLIAASSALFKTSFESLLEKRVEDLETAPPNESGGEKCVRLLKLAYTRSEILSHSSQQRATVLFWLGAIFLIGSIAGPITSFNVYYYSNPLPSETVQNIKLLNEELETSQQPNNPGFQVQSTIVVQRDWRILLGGVTFGFLLLATGSGLLKQRTKELEVHFRVINLVNFYQRLLGVFELKSEVLEQDEEELVEFTVKCLLEPNPTSDTESNDGQYADEDFAKSAMGEYLKAAKAGGV